jgi:DNA-directed RNA polymerase I subunit RPA2
MERDALIAHGTSFLLQDRLMNCSDYSTAWVCRTCGSIISLGYDDLSLGEVSSSGTMKAAGPGGEYCRVCRTTAQGEDERARRALDNDQNQNRGPHPEVTVAIPASHVLGSSRKGGDMDVVAVPYVFRYLCAELAAMGIAVSLEVR